MSTIESTLSIEQLAAYERDGLLRIKLPAEVAGLCREFKTEVCDWLHKMGESVDADNLAAKLPAIAAKDRTLVARLYKVSRRFPAAKRIASDRILSAMSAQLMGTSLVSCCHFVNVRIDLPGEEKYLTPAHQDFPYIQGSYNGVTWWIPFDDTPIKVGPPSFIAGTHKLGVLKVTERDYLSTGKSGARSFEIVDVQKFGDEEYSLNPVMFGEALVFNTLTLHRSEPNQSDLARMNIQVRFDDPFARESFERNYPEGLYLGDEFARTYPEYVQS